MAGWVQCLLNQEFVEFLFLWVWQRDSDLEFTGRTEITSVSYPDAPKSVFSVRYVLCDPEKETAVCTVEIGLFDNISV